MKVAVFNGAGRGVVIEDRPDPPLAPGDVRIAIARCGICGSDVTMTSGTPFDYPCGNPIGHEYSGEVIELGSAATRFKLGDRLACLPLGPCGHCLPCRQGRPLFCEAGRNLAGGFGERMALPENAAFRLPASVSFAEGALAEPMACGRRALRVARLAKGDRVLVLGAGNMALSVIFWARRMGAGRIVTLSRSARRDEIALAMGADACLRLSDPDADADPEAVARALGGGADVVAECIGKPGMLAMAAGHARLGGSVVSLGMCTLPEPIVPALNSFREVSLHFPLAYSLEDFTETIRAFDQGTVRPGDMVSTTVPLDDFPAMLEAMRGDHPYLKVQVAPNPGIFAL